MADYFTKTAFEIKVTAAEAALLHECLDVASTLFDIEDEVSLTGVASQLSTAFRQTFPAIAGDSFASFRGLFVDPDFPEFGVSLTVRCQGDDSAVLVFSGEQVHVDAVARLIRKVCKSALPFSFSWASTCSRMRPGEFGGGYFVITDQDIIGGSTDDLIRQALKK